MMKIYIISCSLLLQLICKVQCQRNYTNYSLYHFTPTTEYQFNFINYLYEKSIFHLIFWRHPTNVGYATEFIVNPKHKKSLELVCKEKQIPIKQMIGDVQSAFDAQTSYYREYKQRHLDSLNWKTYYRLNDIYAWLHDVQEEYPKEVTVKTIGQSVLGRDIKAVVIIFKHFEARNLRKKQTVVIEGGIHGREWISPAFVTYFMNKILHAPKSSTGPLKRCARLYNWYFIPVVNPDGYEYSHKYDRLWRKNLNPDGGVDLNRNFDIDFGNHGHRDKNHINYGGPYAFSEPESLALARFLRTIPSIDYYISVHSYGQLIVVPYCYTAHLYDNYYDIVRLAQSVANTIKQYRGTEYYVGNLFKLKALLVPGVSTDWAKRAFAIPYVFTMELNDRGHFGFAMPGFEIIPICEETTRGLVEMFAKNVPMARTAKHTAKHSESKSVVTSFNGVLLVLNILILGRFKLYLILL